MAPSPHDYTNLWIVIGTSGPVLYIPMVLIVRDRKLRNTNLLTFENLWLVLAFAGPALALFSALQVFSTPSDLYSDKWAGWGVTIDFYAMVGTGAWAVYPSLKRASPAQDLEVGGDNEKVEINPTNGPPV